MTVLLIILYVLVCLFLILVVLLQQGKGADLAGAFGGGGSQTSFGPRSAANIMHRMTTVSFVLFVVLSLALAILSGKQRSSVMESVATPPPAAAESAPAEAPAEVAEPATEPATAQGEPAAQGGEPATEAGSGDESGGAGDGAQKPE